MTAQTKFFLTAAKLFGGALIASTLYAGSASASYNSDMQNCSSRSASATTSCCIKVNQSHGTLFSSSADRANCQTAVNCSKAGKNKWCKIKISRLRPLRPLRPLYENENENPGDTNDRPTRSPDREISTTVGGLAGAGLR